LKGAIADRSSISKTAIKVISCLMITKTSLASSYTKKSGLRKICSDEESEKNIFDKPTSDLNGKYVKGIAY